MASHVVQIEPVFLFGMHSLPVYNVSAGSAKFIFAEPSLNSESRPLDLQAIASSFANSSVGNSLATAAAQGQAFDSAIANATATATASASLQGTAYILTTTQASVLSQTM